MSEVFLECVVRGVEVPIKFYLKLFQLEVAMNEGSVNITAKYMKILSNMERWNIVRPKVF
jgi:hypothetical protein